ncbi:MAG TPA: anti-sigma factor [Candidatus Tumulicola sp.]|nr:anti-sigma factor [Candidatus Tumulicola sp.]
MSARSPHADALLDDVAVYALGALPSRDARRVREHLRACRICSAEYARLKPAADAVGFAAETTGDDRYCPSTLLKPQIMAKVRAEAAAQPQAAPGLRQPLWPAYLVAAACLAIAVVTSVWNVAVTGQLHQAQQEALRASARSRELARSLADERTTLSDLLGSDARRYVQGNGAVIARGGRLYVTMHDLAEPPRGRVYQVWTLPKGAKAMVPASTFVPDAHGVAVIALAADARATAAVAVSVEPEGGSKRPTTKPILLVPLT